MYLGLAVALATWYNDGMVSGIGGMRFVSRTCFFHIGG